MQPPNPEVTGHTRWLAILADPIHHVQTPQRINALLRAQGIDALMVPWHVGPDDLATAMDALRRIRNFEGCVVTVPHKTAALQHCDELSEAARRIGAVNVVHRLPDGRLRGGMLDGIAFVDGLRQGGIEPAGRSVYLAGAGGAACAIAFALADSGAQRLTIANRSVAKAADLVERVRRAHAACQVETGTTDPAGHDLVVNATSLGLHPGDPLPLDASRLSPSQIVAEIIMDPARTALLQAAQARGCRTHEGAPMLACQIPHMAAFMLGLDRLDREPAWTRSTT